MLTGTRPQGPPGLVRQRAMRTNMHGIIAIARVRAITRVLCMQQRDRWGLNPGEACRRGVASTHCGAGYSMHARALTCTTQQQQQLVSCPAAHAVGNYGVAAASGCNGGRHQRQQLPRDLLRAPSATCCLNRRHGFYVTRVSKPCSLGAGGLNPPGVRRRPASGCRRPHLQRGQWRLAQALAAARQLRGQQQPVVLLAGSQQG